MGLKRAYFKINYRLYIYFYRAITPIKYLLLLISSVNICYLPSHFIYLLYLPQCDFKNRSHRMEKGYQWKRIFLSPGKTKLNKTFEHSSWGEKNILNFCEGNILALSFAWNFFSKTRSHPLSVTEFSDSTCLWHGDRGLVKGPRVLNRALGRRLLSQRALSAPPRLGPRSATDWCILPSSFSSCHVFNERAAFPLPK